MESLAKEFKGLVRLVGVGCADGLFMGHWTGSNGKMYIGLGGCLLMQAELSIWLSENGLGVLSKETSVQLFCISAAAVKRACDRKLYIYHDRITGEPRRAGMKFYI